MALVPPGVSGLLDLDSGQTWQDRLKDAAYESPKGTRIKFLFGEVSREVTKRGTVYEFSGINDGYVQEHGFGPRRYPMRCVFTGPDHDRLATAFLAALLEPGVGKLEHPLYGHIPRVVPFGDITQRNDLVNEANMSVVETTFWTTLQKVYPAAESDAENEIEAALDGFDVAAAQKFADNIDLGTAGKRVNVLAAVRGALKQVSAALSGVSRATATVRREFADAVSTVNLGVDVLIGQPLLLAQQMSNLIKAPARAVAGIESRLEGYEDLADRIFGSRAGNPSAPGVIASALDKAANDVEVLQLVAANAVGGSVLSLINNEFASKPEVLGAAEQLVAQFDALIAWNDSVYETLGIIDTGETIEALRPTVALALGFLVQASFTVVPERRIVLDRARTIVDLAAELYGSVDDRLNLLIAGNHLSGDEILELERGRVIRYYPTQV